jgi:RHS repeat-associated protein
MEHWDYFVGTLLAENVGSWSYTELHDGSVYQSREFDVRELSLTASSGAGQIGIVDQELPEPLVLNLQSHEGTGIEGETIGWMIDGPKGARGASVRGIGSGSETNAEGTDQATVRLGSKPGVYTVRLQNRRITGNSEPVFTFTAIDDIQDTDPVTDHPDVEEGVGEGRGQRCDWVGNPVALSIGNKFQREVDLEPSGLSPIGFVRFHNSLGFVSGSFDSYWTHSYDRRVQLPEDLEQEPVKVFRPDGRKINFRATGSGFEPYPGVRSILEQTASGWRFTDEDLTVEYFDQDGLLAEITDLSGRSQTASRDSRGRLLRIDSNTGEYLGFAYDSKERLAEVSDQAGRQWAYLYDSLGRLSQVDNPDGTSRRYHYEDLRHAYALTGITAEDGRRISWYEYDEDGRATASYGPGEAGRVDIHYEPDGSRIVLDPVGNATLYETRIENRRGLLEGISGPVCSQGCGQTETRYTYDSELNVTSETVHGVTTRYGDHDADGRPAYLIQAFGTASERRVDLQYDPRFPGHPIRMIEPSVYAGRSRATSRRYDDSGRLLEETISGFDPWGAAVGRTTTFTWDGPYGQISSIDGPQSGSAGPMSYEYYPDDASEGSNRARLRAVLDAASIRLRDEIRYSATGKILSEQRPNGVTVEYRYHPGSDRIRSVTESADGLFNRTQWTYLPTGQVQRVIIDDETGAELITQFAYDEAQRLRRIESRVSRGAVFTAGQEVSYAFDAAGNVVSETHTSADDPGGELIIERVFDAYGQVDRLTRGGITEDFDYRPDGTLASTTDGEGNTTRYTYDAFKRLTSTRQVGEVVTTFTYDPHGRLTTVVDPENHGSGYRYDDLGNLVEQSNGDSGTTTYTHDAFGRVMSQLDSMGRLTEFHYDPAGRLIAVDRPGLDHDLEFRFDDCSNGVGRLCLLMTGWGHQIQYGWTALGEPASVETSEGRLDYEFGPNRTLESISYPSGRTVAFVNDGGGFPVQIRLRQPGLPESILVDDIRYSATGVPLAWRFANGVEMTTSLDGRHRPRAIDADGQWTWEALAYDGNDNLLNLRIGADDILFSYDALNRLTGVNDGAGNLAFAYDRVGNRLSRTSGGVTEVAEYQPGSNRLERFGNRQYTLDPRGNTIGVTADDTGETRFTYSSHDRLIEILDGPSSTAGIRYRYDALGQRVRKEAPGMDRLYLYGLDGKLLVEMDGDGSVLHEFVYLGGRPVVDLHRLPKPSVPPAQEEIVIDESDAVVVGGNWQRKSSALAVNGTFLQNRKRDDRGVFWYVDQPGFRGGPHDVYVHWMQPANEGSSTVYTIVAADQGSQRVVVDHALASPGEWVRLGNFDFAAAAGVPSQYVSLMGFDNSFGMEGSFLEADAVKIVPTSMPEGYSDIRFIHGDHLGTPYWVSDESGRKVWAADYLPFGLAAVDEDPDGDGTPFTLDLRFPGQYFDRESGLHYNYYRFYDPHTGRYRETDPIGLAGGLNVFNYAEANPVRFSDPMGLDAQFCRRPFYPMPIPYARHCFLRYSGGGSSSFGPSGPGPDPAPDWWPRSCQATDGAQNDECLKREMANCRAEQYDFLGFNCCHCVERAMSLCGISIPLSDWPNWPVNPGPQPGEPGYLPTVPSIGPRP